MNNLRAMTLGGLAHYGAAPRPIARPYVEDRLANIDRSNAARLRALAANVKLNGLSDEVIAIIGVADFTSAVTDFARALELLADEVDA